MSVNSVERAEVKGLPKFAEPDKMIVVLGCAGCHNAIGVKLTGVDPNEVEQATCDIPNTRIRESYSATTPGPDTCLKEECLFAEPIVDAYEKILSMTN